jgi:hypothetical protein
LRNIAHAAHEEVFVPRNQGSIDDILSRAVADAMRKVAPRLQRHLAIVAAEELDRSLALDGARQRPVRRATRARGDAITRWVADRNARRVPKFVIEATGLDTKKKIVARFGEDAAFEKGKPLPKVVR